MITPHPPSAPSPTRGEGGEGGVGSGNKKANLFSQIGFFQTIHFFPYLALAGAPPFTPPEPPPPDFFDAPLPPP